MLCFYKNVLFDLNFDFNGFLNCFHVKTCRPGSFSTKIVFFNRNLPDINYIKIKFYKRLNQTFFFINLIRFFPGAFASVFASISLIRKLLKPQFLNKNVHVAS